MPTRTFPVRSPEPRATPADAIAAIGRGDFGPIDLLPLSDLGRTEASALAAVWSGFAVANRERVVRLLAELAEDSVEYTFGRVFRIALADQSAVVRQRAVAALWEDNGADLLDRLLALLTDDPSQDVRAAAAQALERFAERAAEGVLPPAEADRLRRELLAVAGDPLRSYLPRRRALESVAVFGDEAIGDLIRAAYEADDAGFRAGAVYAMGRSLDRRWLDSILHETESADAEMRFEAARACGQLGDDRAIASLAGLTRDRDTEVRQAAITALGRIGGPAAVNLLRNLQRTAPGSDAELIDEALDEAVLAIDLSRSGT